MLWGCKVLAAPKVTQRTSSVRPSHPSSAKRLVRRGMFSGVRRGDTGGLLWPLKGSDSLRSGSLEAETETSIRHRGLLRECFSGETAGEAGGETG